MKQQKQRNGAAGCGEPPIEGLARRKTGPAGCDGCERHIRALRGKPPPGFGPKTPARARIDQNRSAQGQNQKGDEQNARSQIPRPAQMKTGPERRAPQKRMPRDSLHARQRSRFLTGRSRIGFQKAGNGQKHGRPHHRQGEIAIGLRSVEQKEVVAVNVCRSIGATNPDEKGQRRQGEQAQIGFLADSGHDDPAQRGARNPQMQPQEQKTSQRQRSHLHPVHKLQGRTIRANFDRKKPEDSDSLWLLLR